VGQRASRRDPQNDDQVPSKKEPINITPKALPAPTVEAKPEEPTPPLRRYPGSIHNAVLPDGTPARLPPIDDGWRSHAGTVDSPYSNERLNFEAHHPLPIPPKVRHKNYPLNQCPLVGVSR